MDGIEGWPLPDDVRPLEKTAGSLKEEIRRLKMEAAVWQGMAGLIKGPGTGPMSLADKERTAVADALKGGYALNELPGFLKPARSSCSCQVSAMAVPGRHASLRRKARQGLQDSGFAYGYRRIHGSMTDASGYVVSEKAVRRAMEEEGLVVPHKKAGYCQESCALFRKPLCRPSVRPLFEQRYVQIAPRPPLAVGDVFESGGHKHECRFPVREGPYGPRPPPDLAVGPLCRVICPDLFPMLHGKSRVGKVSAMPLLTALAASASLISWRACPPRPRPSRQEPHATPGRVSP